MTAGRWHNSLLLAGLLASGCSLSDSGSKQITERQEADRAAAAESAERAPTPRINPKTHIAAGQMLERQGDLNGAIEQYERAVAASPNSGGPYNRLGIVYDKLGRYAEADRMFRRGIEADPASATIRNNLGYSYILQKRYVEAAQAFREALKLSPQFKRARMNLAIALGHEGRIEESLAEFKLAVPEDVAHYNLAMVCLQRRDYRNSEQLLQKALAINPACTGAKEQLQKVSRLAQSLPPPPPAGAPTARLAGDVQAQPPGNP
jgi:Flp pilus assembly protein TadD